MSNAAVNKSGRPDFAYPQKAMANAEKRLDNAIRVGDGDATLRALIDISLAQSSITVDNLPQVLSRVDSIADIEQDPCTRSLIYLLSAKIYTNIYVDNKWKYDNRALPLTPISDVGTYAGVIENILRGVRISTEKIL